MHRNFKEVSKSTDCRGRASWAEWTSELGHLGTGLMSEHWRNFVKVSKAAIKWARKV